MTTAVMLMIFGWQPPTPAPPPTLPPPAAKVDRTKPPPIPQPPATSDKTPTPVPNGPPSGRQVEIPIDQPAPPPEARRVVQHLFLRQRDVNLDGRLHASELERRHARHFGQADANGDGFLDANEILYDRHSIGRVARRQERLDFDREGRLVLKDEKPPLPVANIARGVIDALDPNRDGFIEGREVKDAVKSELLPRVLPPPADVPPAQPPEAYVPHPSPSPVPMPAPPSPTPSGSATPMPKAIDPALPAPPPGQGSAPPSAKDELPSAARILANLDKDGDGQLNPTEAVDQLAKNFKTLDRDRNGKLNKDEIDRGLRLARMFGVKPMQPPANYKKDAAGKEQAPPK